MQWPAETVQWFINHPEVTWSGAGLTALGVLFFLLNKAFAVLRRKVPAPPVGNTCTNSGSGEQNIAQGDRPVGKQENIRQDITGKRNISSGTGDIRVEEHHHHYPRTPQGIPLQQPRQAEHLVGREELLNKILTALRPGKVLTLCGPGGIGKTALASRVARELSPDGGPPALFPDGLLFFSFYGRKDVSLAFEHLVRSYSDDAQDNSPEAVCRLLANKQALIILDGAEEADDLPAVLRCCGGCGVLITSRKRSDARDILFEVKRLDKLPAAQAFRLYSNTGADEATVKAICEQLGGWPLALRLAGHYLRNTGESATEYLRWLEKEPFKELGDGKHQDENAALLLRRSMEQVNWKGQFALNIIGVLAFAPFTARPIVALLKTANFNTPWQLCRILKDFIVHRKTWLVHCSENDLRFCRDVLNELVIFGLLEHKGEGWQVSHALIHTYIRTEQPLSRMMLKEVARFYIAFAREQSQAGLPGYALLDKERVHCLRLIESCLERELWQEVKLLVGAIDIYLDRQGHWTELLSALEMNLTAARKAGDRGDEHRCLNSLGYTCNNRGDKDQALAWYEQSLPIARELENRQGEGVTLNNMAEIYRQQGRYDEALEQYEQSLTIVREVGDRKGEGRTLNNIGLLYYAQGEHGQALQQYEQCLPIAQEVGYKILEGSILNNIAMIYGAQDKPSKAMEYYEQALSIRQQLGYRAGEAESRWNIGTTYYSMGDLAQAEEYFAQAVEIAEKIDHPLLEEWRNGLERLRAERQGA